MIDLHVHVLPGIDDGARDEDAAIALVAEAAAAGVTTIAATPHLRADHPAVRPFELAGRTARLQAALDGAGVAVELVSGGEVDLRWAQQAGEDELKAVSYGGHGRDVLAEVPYGELQPQFEDFVFRLRAMGYRVLLAHPERSLDVPTRRRPPAGAGRAGLFGSGHGLRTRVAQTRFALPQARGGARARGHRPRDRL